MPCHGVYRALSNSNENILRPKSKFLLMDIKSFINLRLCYNEPDKPTKTSIPCHGVYPAIANSRRNISRP